jgi:C4-dicarboxylate-specific signal transduction histidine kinase
MDFILTPEILSLIAPYHFTICPDLKIIAVGKELQLVCENIKIGSHFKDTLQLEAPTIDLNFNTISHENKSIFELKYENSITLRGQVLYFEKEGMIAFLVTPLEKPANATLNQINTLIDNMQGGVLVEMSKRTIITANKAFCEMFSISLSPEELRGVDSRPIFEQIKSLLANPDQFIHRVLELREQKKLCLREEVQLANGKIFERDYFPIFSTDNEHIAHVILFRDITESKELTTKLVASANVRAMGELTIGIAHEINSPLTVITCNTTHILNCMEHNNSLHDLPRHLKTIEDSAMRISNIIKSMHFFSRNSTFEDFQDTEVLNIITDVLNLCRGHLKLKGIELRLAPIPPILKIHCHRIQIGQALLNLINNACDAIAGLNEKWIAIDFTCIFNRIKITVTDSGFGISEDLCHKIMEPFFTTKPIGKGTGLGLAISKRTIEAHQGILRVDTSFPRTRFLIELPTIV